MKRVVPLLLVACATPSAPVTVAAPPIAPHAALRGTLLGGCTIEGDGERTRTRRNEYDQDIPFDLFPTRDASEPVLALADPAHAHVIWSHFPLPASDARFPRAEVELRGLGIRYRGWANLYGRTFTATRRLDAEHGHVWAHAGAPLDVMSSSDDGVVFARVATRFDAPSSIVVEGTCADVRYEPDAPATRPARTSRSPVGNGKVMHLFMTSDAGSPFTAIVAAPRTLDLDALARAGDRVHVAFDSGVIGFDAWVPASEIDDAPAVLPGPPAEIATTAPPPRALPDQARVTRDAPVYIEDPPRLLAIATLEAGTTVMFDPASEVTVEGQALVAFELASGAVTAKYDRMWTRKDALAR